MPMSQFLRQIFVICQLFNVVDLTGTKESIQRLTLTSR